MVTSIVTLWFDSVIQIYENWVFCGLHVFILDQINDFWLCFFAMVLRRTDFRNVEYVGVRPLSKVLLQVEIVSARQFNKLFVFIIIIGKQNLVP